MAAQKTPQPVTVDCHAHVFHRGLPLARERRYAPGTDAPLDLYLQQLDNNAIGFGVLVQPSFLGTDNAYLLDGIAKSNGRLRGIAVTGPETLRPDLQGLAAAGVAGIRLNLVGQPLPEFKAPLWVAFLENVAAAGLHIEVQRGAADLARLVPHLLKSGADVVVDHFGLPDHETGIDDPGFQALLSLAASPRLWMKVSGAYRASRDPLGFARQAYPLLRDAFGTGRLVWGSDWPHTQYEPSQSYEDNRDILDRFVPNEHERAVILRNGIGRYGFGF